MKQLTNNQVGVCLSLSIISLKLFIFPSLLSRYAGKNCHIAVLLSIIVEFLLILLILNVIKKYPNKSFFEILEGRFGKIFPRILSAFLSIYFLSKSFVSLKELQNFLVQLLFEHISWIKFAIPLFAILLYMLNKSFRTFARSIQFFYYFIFIGAIITLVLPIAEVDFINLLPIWGEGIQPIFSGIFHTSFHFIDFLVLLVLMGRIKYDNNTSKTIIKYSIFTYLLILIYFLFYVSLFGNILVNEGLLVSSIPLYSNYPATNGRLEWLSMIVWTIVLVYQTGLMLICARESFSYTTCIKNNSVISLIISIVMAFALYFAYLDYAGIIRIITTPIFNIVLLSYIAILMVCVVVCLFGGKNETKIQKVGQ